MQLYNIIRCLKTEKRVRFFSINTLNSLFFFLSLTSLSCSKLVEVPPPITLTDASQVYSDDSKAAAVLTSIYNNISQNTITAGGITSLSFYTALSSDELALFNPSSQIDKLKVAFYSNSLSSTMNVDYWTACYPLIFTANSAIEGLMRASFLTAEVKQQLIGEAKFIRAFCFFYLTNLYGAVPLPLTTNYKINGLLPRTPSEEVYKQIISDLKDAELLLKSDYVDASTKSSTNERVRPNKWATKALLARAYLYMQDYKNAEAKATEVIEQSTLYGLAPLANVFQKNSIEAIWQLQPVRAGQNTSEATLYILPPTGPDVNDTHPVYLSNGLANSFESGDNRENIWIGSIAAGGIVFHFPYKYKINVPNAPVSEYLMVLRLGEQYLIRAEARAHEDNIVGAINDLNVLRSRARGDQNPSNQNPLPDLSSSLSKDAALNAVYQERRVELFAEWGHRWFDLKRTGRVNEVMKTVTDLKGGSWNSNLQWYPVPLKQLQLNPNVIQNDGYN
ncbi:RagB/SusD family nutrient uptake outer membrane protein [Chitinophaga sp. CF418]|uniref:RagB/SusD family nutrient uptake outer membrane protein n=1 Tax=Chitinophaga sp. CF418 TaxID=1855287 RepID=UPI00092450CB|nr:RagB/SusD family nutrient uptake outer membrane protein [Chitinophaga sp. CF418]SHN41852.1 SusD family protein [Chitinophaga sp. CF418]